MGRSAYLGSSESCWENVAHATSVRAGSRLEIVGRYNPQTDPSTIEFDETKVKEWLDKGALPTPAVAKLLKAKQGG